MSKVYVGQTLLTITLDTKTDISDADVFEIDYRKPDGTEGTWTGALSGTQKIAYTIQSGDLDQAGGWTLQAKVTNSGAIGYGNPATLQVFNTI